MSENKEYDSLLPLWIGGKREYHRLTATYVTANSLLITSISFLMKDVAKSEFVVLIISCIGLFLCFNMKVAQSRLSGENYYWERNLRIIEYKKRKKGENEKKEVPLSHNLFSDLNKLMNNENFSLDKEHGEGIMYRNYGMVLHNKRYARRMKLYPPIFGSIFGLFITYLFAKLIIVWGKLPMPLCLVIPLFFVLSEYFIIYILQPEREEKLGTLEKKKENQNE